MRAKGCESMSEAKPTSLAEYLGELHTQSPEAIVSQIRVDLESLIDRMVAEKTKALFVVGRKSRHLFHPLTSRLLEEGFSINFLNVMAGKIDDKRLFYFTIPNGGISNEISLLADSINEGYEKAGIIENLRNDDIEVKRLYCYVVNERGLDFLKSEEIFDTRNVFSIHTLPPSQYELFYKRLQIYYQSRVEPMDVDHEFDIFSVAEKIEGSDLYDKFKDCIRKSLKCDKGSFSRGKVMKARVKGKDDVNANFLFVPANIVNYNFECYEYNQCKDRFESKIQSTLKDLGLEYLQIRLKAELAETESTISLMAFCPPVNIDLNSLIVGGNCRPFIKKCRLDSGIFGEDVSREEVATIVCPQCLENSISREILQRLEENFEI